MYSLDNFRNDYKKMMSTMAYIDFRLEKMLDHTQFSWQILEYTADSVKLAIIIPAVDSYTMEIYLSEIVDDLNWGEIHNDIDKFLPKETTLDL